MTRARLGASIGQLLAMLLFVYARLASAGGTVPLQALPVFLRTLAEVREGCGRSLPAPGQSCTSTPRPTLG